MYTIGYFSPTGNTKYLATQLKEQLNVENMFALENPPKELPKADTLILMSSIQGFNHPRTTKRFLKNLPENLYQNVHIISVGCTTSFINSSASKRSIKLLEDKGVKILSNSVLPMPLTLVMSFPDDLIEDTINESLEMLKDFPNNLNEVTPSFKSNLLTGIGKAEDFAARFYGLELHAKKNCTSCGICWNRCPENNIKEKNGIPKFGLKCIMCLRCVYECPEEAITPYISKFITHKKQYNINNHIKKSE